MASCVIKHASGAYLVELSGRLDWSEDKSRAKRFENPGAARELASTLGRPLRMLTIESADSSEFEAMVLPEAELE